MGFASEQIERLRPMWERMLDHPFLLETRAGRIGEATFATWMKQDYLFVEAAIPFIAALLPKAPPQDRSFLSGALGALETELELFRERAAARGISLGETRPALINHAYIQFLMATAYRGTYPEGMTVLYVAEKAYFDSWRVVRAGLAADSPWQPFVENWSGPAFAEWVDSLEACLDRLAGQVGDEERERMGELFELTVRYEIAFWEMAYQGLSWPGLERGDRP